MILNTSETVCITPQPCHSHFCCWFLPIWPKLDVSAENGAYGLCRIGWRYNRAKLYFSWPYMIVSMIWNNYETVCITPQPCHSHFCCWLLPIWPYLYFCAENGAYGLGRLGWRYNGENMSFLLTLYDSINDIKYFWNFCITPQPCHSHFCCWFLPIWP